MRPPRDAHGLLLAAGAGSRMGMPKALVRDRDGAPWLARSVRVLLDGGCAAVTVVLGAAAEEAAGLLPGDPRVSATVAADWADGMAASLRAGLEAVVGSGADAALVHLVDLPDVTEAVVARVLAAAAGPATLARAAYEGRPGHPVLLGRDHWEPLGTTLAGDEGARAYLAAHAPRLVECGDLATGADVDHR